MEAHCNLNPAYHLGLSMAHIQKVEGEKEQIQSEVAALRIQLLQTAQAGRRY